MEDPENFNGLLNFYEYIFSNPINHPTEKKNKCNTLTEQLTTLMTPSPYSITAITEKCIKKIEKQMKFLGVD